MRLFPIILLFSSFVFSQVKTGYISEPVFEFTSVETTLVDKERNRSLDLKIFIPERQHDERVFPVIFFSPDALCGEDDYGYLSTAWAKAGIITIFVSHPPNLEIIEKEVNTIKYVQALERTSEYINRSLDMKFLLRELFWNRISSLRGLADISRIGVAGHALGTHTALSLAGQTFAVRDSIYTMKDKMVKAVLGLSGQGPNSFGLTENSWDKISVPVMLMYGTSDRGVGIHNEEDRRWAYEHISSDEKYYVSLSGATKGVFSEAEKRGFRTLVRDPRHHTWITDITTAYWKSVFKNDTTASRWLKSGKIEDLSYKECLIDYPGKERE